MSLEYLIWTQVLSMIFGFSKGTISIIAGNSYLIKGEPASLICEVNPLEAPVTWKTSAFQTGGLDDTQTTCFPAGNCIPSNSGDDARYSFSSSIGSGQFNGTMSISTVVCPTDSATYTCEHGNAANEKTSRQLTVQVIPSTVGITESGLTITAKTDCLAEPSALQRQWYKVYANGTNEEYTPPNLQASYDDSGCPTDGCGTTEVISSFVHINPSKGPIVEVTFKVKVWHSAEPSSTFDAETVQKYQFQGTTTTTTTATTITSPTTIMTASSTTATTTSSVPTTSISKSTTKMLVSSSVTASLTASSTVTSTKSTEQTPSTPTGSITPVSDRDSDKAIVTMIIVVSVIGGVLIVAIFSIIFVMIHWKSCFTRRGHSKQYAQRSDHRTQHRQAEYNASGRFLTTQQDHAMGGYYFYNGTYKNPLFYDSFENSSNLNNYYPNQKNSHDPKYMSSHETYQYKYDRDYNWDLKDRY